MSEDQKTILAVCQNCDGTGLYQGAWEEDAAAVICYKCNGKGYIKIQYTPFESKKKRDDVERVFQSIHGYGFVHSSKDNMVNDVHIPFSQYGVSYEDWLNGYNPLPVRELYCPLLYMLNAYSNFTYQKQCSLLGCQLKCGQITDCPKQETKADCWKKWDDNNGRRAND